MFIDVLRKILYNEININTCGLVYCPWCSEFVHKSKFKLFEEQRPSVQDQEETSTKEPDSVALNGKFEDLTCTKCSRYLIKNSQVQSPDEHLQSDTGNPSNTLKKSPTFAGFSKDALNVSSPVRKVPSAVSLGGNYTLKEALDSFKETELEDEESASEMSKTNERMVVSEQKSVIDKLILLKLCCNFSCSLRVSLV